MQNGVPFIIHWDNSDKVLFVICDHVLLVIITFCCCWFYCYFYIYLFYNQIVFLKLNTVSFTLIIFDLRWRFRNVSYSHKTCIDDIRNIKFDVFDVIKFVFISLLCMKLEIHCNRACWPLIEAPWKYSNCWYFLMNSSISQKQFC